MNFKEFRDLLQSNVNHVIKDHTVLFVTDVDKEVLWDMYLSSFSPGKNEIYRTRREFDCSCCKQFIRQFGNVVVIDNDYTLKTIWDFETDEDTYAPVIEALSAYVKSMPVVDVFATSVVNFGTAQSREMRESGVHTWNHFHVEIPTIFKNAAPGMENTVAAQARDKKSVFRRALDEIAPTAVQDVLDMIDENTLYRGEEWKSNLVTFLKLQAKYNASQQKDNFAWLESTRYSGTITGIRNHSIGTLLVDLTEGVDVDTAIRKWEAVMAPANYKRPKPVFTAKMVEQAEKTAVELGLLESLPRRFARLGDITVNNVLWVNRDARKYMAGTSGIFQAMKTDVVIDPRSTKNVPSIGIDELLAKLQQASDIQVLMENRLSGNLVSLIAPVNSDAPSMFKWNNGFSWAYSGNVTDSMKEQVKAAGGDVTGILRFSIRWNDQVYNPNDYDAHAIEPGGIEICYYQRQSNMGGRLDVDIIAPEMGRPAVENITWQGENNLLFGQYRFFVHCFSHRGGDDGFDAEIEFAGDVHSYSYRKNLRYNEKVYVATLLYSHANGMRWVEELEHKLGTTQREIWGIKTNQWQPISTVLYSPNYWDNSTVGNRHYFFMISGCQNDDQPNGFFNEYLPEALTPHRKVFEALGKRMKVEPASDQLSGLGFSSTKRENAIFKIDGKPVKVVF